MFSTFLKKYNFRAYGVYIDAFTNENGAIKKSTAHPAGKATEKRTKDTKYPKKDLIKCDEPETKYNYFGSVYSRILKQEVKPNAIAIITKHSNISCLDVDKPEQCIILDRLLNDCNFIVKTKNGYHFYFIKEDILPRNDCRNGIIDINTGLLFYCPKYTHHKTGQEFKYEIIKSEDKLNDMPDYAIEYCKTLISISDNMKIEKNKNNINIKTNTNKADLIIKPDIEINKFNLETIDSILDIFYNALDGEGLSLFVKRNSWFNIGWMIRHLNNSYEALELYHKYSIKIEKFKNSSIESSAIGFYNNNEYNLNFDENLILYKCCKLDRNKYANTLKHLENNKYEKLIYKFNTQYIKPENGENEYIFEDWINNYKILCLKSAYGTGKTHTFKNLIKNNENKFKRILFITYRQSLATSLGKDLSKNYGFKNYLEIDGGDFTNVNRLILQLDSIYKLNNNDEDGFQIQGFGYDLLVLDEIEGILNHLSFNKINQFQIHNKLLQLIEHSKKVLVSDGDLGNRTLDFISDISNSYKIYENEYKPNKKHFQFISNKNIMYKKYFDGCIENDINDGLKVVIVSMTKTQTVKYHEEYTLLGKKCIIHNSLTKNKKILEDVNTTWKDCDLLTYSPSVESGIDFNVIDHFDKCYAILESRSTSYRAFCQMINRVRYYKQNNIMCLMPMNMRYKLDDVLIRFDEIKIQKYKGLEITNLLNILIHNDVERSNSTNYFISSLCGMLEKKGHTFEEITDARLEEILRQEAKAIVNNEYIRELMEIGTPQQINSIGAILELEEDQQVFKLFELKNIYRTEVLERVNMINGKRVLIKGTSQIIKNIHNSKTLTDTEFQFILRKQKTNKQITDDEVLSLNKMIYMKVFKFLDIEKMTKNKLTLLYNNIETVKNYDNLLFNQKSNNIISRLVKDDNDILGKFEMSKLSTINDLIKNLGFEITNDTCSEVIINKYTVNFETSKNLIVDFIQKQKTLFNSERLFKNLNWLKCLNDILKLYGLEAVKVKTRSRVEGSIDVNYTIELYKMDVLDFYIRNCRQYYTTKINDIETYNGIVYNGIKDINKKSRYDLKMYYKELFRNYKHKPVPKVKKLQLKKRID